MTDEPSLVIEDADGNRYDDGSVAWGDGVWGDFVWGGGGTLEEAKITQLLDTAVTREPTAVSEARVTLPAQDYQTLRDNWVRPDTNAYIYVGDELLYRGFLTTSDARKSGGEVTFTIPDIVEKLNRGEQAVTYQNIPTWEAIEDYGNTYTDFTWNVTEPPITQLFSDKEGYNASTTSELNDAFDIADTDPFTITGDQLLVNQTCWTQDAQDRFSDTNASIITTEDTANNGTLFGVGQDGAEVVWRQTVNHTIPEENVSCHVRTSDVDNTVESEIAIAVDGAETVIDNFIDGGGFLVEWVDFANNPFNGGGWTGGDIPAGSTVDVILRGTGAASAGNNTLFDVVALNDNRYNYTFDNTLDGNQGYLDGPELYPDQADVNSTQINDTANITEVDVTADYDDFTNNQALRASNDGGTTYQQSDNTESATFTFTSTYGTTLDMQLRFSRYGSRSGETPKTGFNGQVVSSFTADYDGNDLSVIDEIELRDSHFKNQKRLHEFAGRDFVADYQVDDLVIESFPDGTENTADWRRVDYQETKDTRGYANRVVVRGKRDEDGEYPEAIATDSAEVTAFGDTVTVTLITDLETQASVNSAARTQLGERTGQLDAKATLDILAKDVKPGYTYTVPAVGRDLKLERVTYSDGGQRFTGSLEFIRRITETEQTVSVRSDFDDTQESL